MYQELIAPYKNDPVGLARLCGKILGTNYRFTDHFFDAFGEKLFEDLRIADRIDCLHELCSKPVKHDPILATSVVITRPRGIVCLRDICGRWNHRSIMLLRNLKPDDSFAIRAYESLPAAIMEKIKVKPTFSNILGEDRPLSKALIADHCGPTDHCFWNFKKANKTVEVCKPSEGFHDLIETKRVAHFIQWTSNILGFEKARQRA